MLEDDDCDGPMDAAEGSFTARTDGASSCLRTRKTHPPSGAVWAYNVGVSDGKKSVGEFFFYPRAAGWRRVLSHTGFHTTASAW
jgi:hypothetical protein